MDNIEDLVQAFGCWVGTLPSSYLGLPLGASLKSVSIWDGVEERFCKRLALWKRQYISKKGWLSLLKITVSSLPIYFMSFFFFCILRLVMLRLEQIQ